MNSDNLRMDYLEKGRVMQLATIGEDGPWLCSVYYVVDETLNLYWLSLPGRRHSRMVAENSKVAVAIVVQQDLPVVGIQANGDAGVVDDSYKVREVMELYSQKYSTGHDFYNNFLEGTNKHQLYKFTACEWQVFDEVNFRHKSPFRPELD